IELQGEPPSILRRPKGCEFHTRCPFIQPRCSADVPAWRVEGASAHRCHFPEIWTKTGTNS
ncbi:MAG: oligopeptide/dipeptide ABC transporter ATP-binding protein, partial [Paracoccaceae bacterium]